MGIHLINLALNIVTLGIYSFWGKTRIRKYLSSHTALGRDRFEYTGTGKELLIGWVKALAIFLPLFICLSIRIVQLFAYPVFFGILAVALFLSLRYRLSRTRWRGIRFHLGGTIKEYFIISIKRTLINIVTLGWQIPKSDLIRWSYIANNMKYGEANFTFEGSAKRLQKIHLITASFFVFPLLFFFGLGIEAGISGVSGNVAQTIEQRMDSHSFLAGIAILMFYVGFLARIWYRVALWHEKFRGLYLAHLRFKIDITAGGVIKLFITNMLIIIFTLGIGMPIATQRTLRYFVTNMRIGGDLEQLMAEQLKASDISGMGDELAADVGFDLAL